MGEHFPDRQQGCGGGFTKFLSLGGALGGEFVEDVLPYSLGIRRGVRGGHGGTHALLDTEGHEARLRGGAGAGQVEERFARPLLEGTRVRVARHHLEQALHPAPGDDNARV